ncbi:cardiotrophin-2-like [Carcharodon carcharias]|uniref:cardiotrophin-2-like n=1 Tax=Carcharodon carcharias TaxID=13397 RepID=UPI001B7E1EC4|nr:cardiotrophin-2-like [Carcharodon carcharias]
MQHLRGVLLMGSFLVQCQSASIAVPTLIRQTHDLSLLLQSQASSLLSSYVQQMGRPFSDPDFSLPGTQLQGLPQASVPYLSWRGLSHQQRLADTYQAYSLYAEFLQLVLDDVEALGLSLGPGKLWDRLTFTKVQVEGLRSNARSLLDALRYPLPVVGDPLDPAKSGHTDFERKVRGYIVCRGYRDWINRTVRDFQLLSYYFPA